ncbi:MAG: hypothetical protein K0Q51_1447 [Rickettsiaceae bacterium]|jgi:hypothetical protein|nr:hypothetical protein [Rickettsiaceae bacterium]
MPNLKQPTYDELINTMSSDILSSTNKWDVLCSYKLAALNQVLHREHQKTTLSQIVNFSSQETDPITDEPYTQNFYIKFGAPDFSFIEGVSNACVLKFPIEKDSYSQITLKDGTVLPQKNLPLGYTLISTVQLTSIKGNDNNHVEAGKVVEFGDKDHASIALHFDIKEAGSSFKIEPAPANPAEGTLLTSLKNAFALQTEVVNYNIIKLTSDSIKDKVVLTPKSFVFTSQALEANDGILNVWVQTKESGHDQGDPHPYFKPHNTEMLPIPQNHSSSIIFSKQLIEKLYIEPAFHYPINFVNLDINNQPINGITAKLSPSNYTHSFNYDNHDSWGNGTSFNCTEMVIDYNKNPQFLNFFKDQINFSWKWTQDFIFESYSHNYTPGSGNHSSDTSSGGGVRVKAELNKSFGLKDVSSLADDAFTLNINIGVDNTEFTTENIGAPYKFGDWWPRNEVNTGLNDSIKQSVNDAQPRVQINLGSLNYFAEANVFFTEQVFKADTTTGINIPGDLVVVGNLSDLAA